MNYEKLFFGIFLAVCGGILAIVICRGWFIGILMAVPMGYAVVWFLRQLNEMERRDIAERKRRRRRSDRD